MTIILALMLKHNNGVKSSLKTYITKIVVKTVLDLIKPDYPVEPPTMRTTCRRRRQLHSKSLNSKGVHINFNKIYNVN